MKKIKIFGVSLCLLISSVIVSLNSHWANASVSTSYELASPRIAGGSYSQTAQMRGQQSITGDGRYIVFMSQGDDLVPSDTNGYEDVFVRDTVLDTTTRVNVSSSGVQANSYSQRASISYDGRYVVFTSNADNLTPGVVGTSRTHVYKRDLLTGTTSLVDSGTSGNAANHSALYPNLSADGRFVVFSSRATDIIAGYTGPSGIYQVYIKDTYSNSVKLLSITSTSVPGNNDSFMPSISCDGNVVAFASKSSNLGVATTGRFDLMVATVGWGSINLTNATSTSAYGIQIDPSDLQVSCNGNKVMFTSSSPDIVSPSTPSGYVNIYQYDRLSGASVQVSLGNGNVQADSFHMGKDMNASMSDDGRFVAFSSFAHNMDTSYPTGGAYNSSGANVYIRDMKNSTTELASILSTGNTSGWAGGAAISPDGSNIAFRHTTAGTYAPDRTLISGLTTGMYAQSTDIYKTNTGH